MKPLRVLSLFDGISCGQVALERAGMPVEVYYASEIDKYAIQVTQKNYPNTIQLGDVTKIDFTDFIGKVDLLIGGSPCQSLSITQSKTRQNLDGKSKLFFEYLRAFETIKPKYFLLENVASMTDECKKVITSLIGVEPLFIDSNCFSAQDRPRLYWTNLPVDVSILKESSLSLKDIMEKNVDKKYFYNCDFDYLGDKKVSAILHINGHDILKRVHSPNFKSHTLTTCGGGNTQKKVMDNGRPRKLTPLEYERLQTLPDNYTSCVSNSQRYNTCGNGWTVDVIAHIFKYLK
jgi:DNA (cytosine-5)-methyltransferase 3A